MLEAKNRLVKIVSQDRYQQGLAERAKQTGKRVVFQPVTEMEGYIIELTPEYPFGHRLRTVEEWLK